VDEEDEEVDESETHIHVIEINALMAECERRTKIKRKKMLKV
jgi:hypothetical protein